MPDPTPPPDPSAWRPAADLAAATFTDAIVSLGELFLASLRAGQALVTGRTFVNCRLEGPAVMLALGGVDFDGCDLGDSKGDIRSLLLKPLSPQRVTGALPFGDCRFSSCSFFAVGFTGGEGFLDQMLAVQSRPAAAEGAS